MERGFDFLLTARAVFEQTLDVEPVEERLVVMRLAISQRCDVLSSMRQVVLEKEAM